MRTKIAGETKKGVELGEKKEGEGDCINRRRVEKKNTIPLMETTRGGKIIGKKKPNQKKM